MFQQKQIYFAYLSHMWINIIVCNDIWYKSFW